MMSFDMNLYPFPALTPEQDADDASREERRDEMKVEARIAESTGYCTLSITFRDNYDVVGKVEFWSPTKQHPTVPYREVPVFGGEEWARLIGEAIAGAVLELEEKRAAKKAQNQEKYEKLLETGPDGIDEICSC
tara:strand:+ start:149 stop:550 length:402 start_codon:yes stop_codon:yes gene_type:complete